jgi:hypothetical protein
MFATVLREPVEILGDILQAEGIIRPALDPPCERGLQPDELPDPHGNGCEQMKTAAPMPPVRQLLPILFEECIPRGESLEFAELNLMLRLRRRAAKLADKGPSFLTTLTKKYNLTELDIDQEIPAIATGFFQVTPGERNPTLAETTLRAAATDRSSETMALLTKYLEERHENVIISETVMQLAAENEECGDYIVHLLLSYSLARSQRVVISDVVLEAAARNETCGDNIMDLLLEYDRVQCDEQRMSIPEHVLRAAIENTEVGDDILTLILQRSTQGNEPTHITENLLIATIENQDLGDRILSTMLDHGCEIPVFLTVLAAAAANLHHGPDLIRRLLVRVGGNVRITDDILVAALHNEVSGLEVLKVVKQQMGGNLPLTEPILVAIVAQETVDELIEFWPINLDDKMALVTQAVLASAARNPACSKGYLERLLQAADCPFGNTTAILFSTMDDMDKATILLNYVNVPQQSGHTAPVRVLAAAAASLDCCLDKALLLKLLPGDMPISSDVLEAAAGNPIHGYDVTKLLLDHFGQNLIVSEGVLVAAATNPQHGARILQLLLERQPEAEATDAPIAAAAARGNGTLQMLLQQRDKSSLPPFEVTESLLAAAISNKHCDAKDVEFLLDFLLEIEGDCNLPATDAPLIAAGGNIKCGYEIMTTLLGYAHPESSGLVTENVLVAAAGNSLWGVEILALLIDQGYDLCFSTEVFAAAQENIYCGKEIIAFMLRYQGPSFLDEDDIDYCESDSSDVEASSSSAEEEDEDNGSTHETDAPARPKSSQDGYETANSE